MNFKIITDSCCDLGKARLKELGVAVAPLGVDFGDRFELDGELDLKNSQLLLAQQLHHPHTHPPATQTGNL